MTRLAHSARCGATVVLIALLGVSACGGGDDDDSDAALQTQVSELEQQVQDLEAENAELRTQLSTPDASPPETTEQVTTTTTPVATTTPPIQGMLWRPPADEGIGTFTANDTVTRLTAVLIVDTTQHTGDYVDQCQREIDFEVELNNWTNPPTYCLHAEWSYDVGANAPVSEFADEVCLSPDDMVSLDGRQITKAVTSSALPGTRENLVSEDYAGGGATSLLRFDVGNNEVRQDYQVQIPGPEAFVPTPAEPRRTTRSLPARVRPTVVRHRTPGRRPAGSRAPRHTRPTRPAAGPPPPSQRPRRPGRGSPDRPPLPLQTAVAPLSSPYEQAYAWGVTELSEPPRHQPRRRG